MKKNVKYLLVPILLLCVFFPFHAFAGGSIKEIVKVLKPGDKDYNSSYRYNCVFYARWLTGGALPSGLSDLTGKKSIINTDKPKKSRVAIMDIYGNIGHVGYVLDADTSGDNLSITLLEANYPSGVIRKRTIKGKNVKLKDLHKFAKILGYWKP